MSFKNWTFWNFYSFTSRLSLTILLNKPLKALWFVILFHSFLFLALLFQFIFLSFKSSTYFHFLLALHSYFCILPFVTSYILLINIKNTCLIIYCFQKRKMVGDSTSTQVLRDLEISLRTNHIEYVLDSSNRLK